MSFGPQVVMPGALHFEAPNGDPVSGVHAGIFRPPLSPPASNSVYLAKSTGGVASDATTPATFANRKRLRAGEATPSYNGTMDGSDTGNDRLGQMRMGNGTEIRYTLGGRIETPTGLAQKQLGGDMESSIYSDVDYRRALGSKRAHDEMESPLTGQNRTDLPREPQEAQTSGWGMLAFNAIGGVVGKVWEFCKTGAFRGFYAGGGRGFDADANPHQGNDDEAYQTSTSNQYLDTVSTSTSNQYLDTVSTSTSNQYLDTVSGGLPESDYAPYYYEHETPESTPPPPAKRRQVSAGTPGDELRKNWVMVTEPTEKMGPPVLPPSPAVENRPSLNRRISKPVSRLSAIPSFNRRHSDRISHAGNSSLSFRQPASFASPRASMAAPERPATPSSTPSRLPVAVRPQSPAVFSPSPRQSLIPSPSPHIQRGHRRNESAASPASLASPASAAMGKAPMRRREPLVQKMSPRLDPEAQHMVARRMWEERATDARINDFNARLQAMIRQGKEALGTEIEVDDDGRYGDVVMDHWEDE